MSEAAPPRPGNRLPLGRDFWYLLSGSNVSLLGDVLGSMALIWVIMERTGSVTAMSQGLLLRLLPPVILGPVAGAILDRYPRKYAMMAADLINGIVTSFVAFTLWRGTFVVGHAFLMFFVSGVVHTFHGPSSIALLPSLVSRDSFQRANALQATARGAVSAGGAAVAGFAIRYFGEAAALAFDAATFFFAVASIGLIRSGYQGTRANPGDSPRRSWQDLRAGVAFILRTPVVWQLMLVANLVNLAGAPSGVLVPAFTRETLGGDVAAFGVMTSVGSVGSLLGPAIVAARGSMGQRSRVIVLTVLGIGVGRLLFALSPNTTVATAAWLVISLPGPLMAIAYNAIYRDAVPEALRGRVYAWRYNLSMVLTPVAVAAAGPLADAFGPRPVLIVLGLIATGAALLAAASPALRDW